MSGETEQNVSGWTVDTVHVHLLDLIREHKEQMERLLAEKDLRDEQRFVAAQQSIAAALTAAERAVLKAEGASERRFEAVNEFRAQLSDQQNTFMPRSEAQLQFTTLKAEIAGVAASTVTNASSILALGTTKAAEDKGQLQVRALVFSLAALALAVLGAVLAIRS